MDFGITLSAKSRMLAPVHQGPTSSVPNDTPYVVSGCGYDRTNGDVTIVVHSPIAVSWTGRTPDANGCFSVTNFSTQGAGHYDVDAWQAVRNKSRVVASTSFDLN